MRVPTIQRQSAVNTIVHSAPKGAQLGSPGQEPPQAGAGLGADTKAGIARGEPSHFFFAFLVKQTSSTFVAFAVRTS